MPNTKTKKFDFQVFLAVFLLLLVICCAAICCVFGTSENGVASADSSYGSAGTVNNNLFTNSKFDKQGESVFNFQYRYSQDVVYPKGTTLSYVSTNGGYLVATTTTDAANRWMAFLFKPTITGTYTFTINCDIVGTAGYNFRLRDTNYVTYVDSNSANFNDYISITYNITDLSKNYVLQLLMPNSNVSASIYWLKIEHGSSFTGYVPDYQNQINDLQNQINDLQNEVNRLNGIITSQRNEIHYYESLLPNQQEVPFFDIERCKPSMFTYNGVTYSSDTITATESGWDIYDSRYRNKQLPANTGVGFSLFLTETMNNTKFQISPFIQAWYKYTGRIDMLLDFSIGYRNQNGQVVKIGDFSNAPGFGTAEFIINSPTNEIVFFKEQSNFLEMSKNMSANYYKVNTQVIYDEAYQKGIKHGYNYGYYAGKQDGIEFASDYSFFSLFSAVFDAPITAIVGKWGDSDGDGVYQREGGMLNFYVPGLDINFAPFLLSLFTIGIIVLIIRFILARKS